MQDSPRGELVRIIKVLTSQRVNTFDRTCNQQRRWGYESPCVRIGSTHIDNMRSFLKTAVILKSNEIRFIPFSWKKKNEKEKMAMKKRETITSHRYSLFLVISKSLNSQFYLSLTVLISSLRLSLPVLGSLKLSSMKWWCVIRYRIVYSKEAKIGANCNKRKK